MQITDTKYKERLKNLTIKMQGAVIKARYLSSIKFCEQSHRQIIWHVVDLAFTYILSSKRYHRF